MLENVSKSPMRTNGIWVIYLQQSRPIAIHADAFNWRFKHETGCCKIVLHLLNDNWTQNWLSVYKDLQDQARNFLFQVITRKAGFTVIMKKGTIVWLWQRWITGDAWGHHERGISFNGGRFSRDNMDL
jgi:hypothetical protein